MKKIFSLVNDIRSLYFATGNKNIENLFLRVANASQQEIEYWFSLDHNIKSIRGKIRDSKIIDAILLLKDIKSQYPAGLDIMALQGGPKSLVFDPRVQRLLEYLIIFKNLYGRFDILTIYQSYIDMFGKIGYNQPLTLSESSIIDDLTIIQNEIEKESAEVEEAEGTLHLSKKDQINIAKVEMYSYLFKRISTELAKEAADRGLNDLANAFNSGYLDSPYDLSKTTSIYNPSKQDNKSAQSIVKVVLKNYGTENFQKNYEYIKSEVLQSKSLLPANDPLSKEKRDYLNFKFILNPEDREKWKKQKEQSWIHKNILFLQPESLTFLSTMFLLYHKEVTNIIKYVPDSVLDTMNIS